MSLEKKIDALFRAVISEVNRNPDFAAKLERIFTSTGSSLAQGDQASPEFFGDSSKLQRAIKRPKRNHRRAPGPLDPFEIMESGEDALRTQLMRLSVEQLKDIVAEHGMDRAKLAMKWKTSDRLVDLIISTVRSRAKKGIAFRTRS